MKEKLTFGSDETTVSSIIQALAESCYNNAKDHGFWDDEDILLKIIEQCTVGKPLQDNKQRIISLFNSEKIALEHSELSERLETLRKDPTKLDEHCPEFFNVEIEVADLIIRALDFAGRRNLRIGEALIAKMKYNKSRPFKHDKNF